MSADTTIHHAFSEALSHCRFMPDNPLARTFFALGVAWAIDAASDDLGEEAWHKLHEAMTEFLADMKARFFNSTEY